MFSTSVLEQQRVLDGDRPRRWTTAGLPEMAGVLATRRMQVHVDHDDVPGSHPEDTLDFKPESHEENLGAAPSGFYERRYDKENLPFGETECRKSKAAPWLREVDQLKRQLAVEQKLRAQAEGQLGDSQMHLFEEQQRSLAMQEELESLRNECSERGELWRSWEAIARDLRAQLLALTEQRLEELRLAQERAGQDKRLTRLETHIESTMTGVQKQLDELQLQTARNEEAAAAAAAVDASHQIEQLQDIEGDVADVADGYPEVFDLADVVTPDLAAETAPPCTLSYVHALGEVCHDSAGSKLEEPLERHGNELRTVVAPLVAPLALDAACHGAMRSIALENAEAPEADRLLSQNAELVLTVQQLKQDGELLELENCSLRELAGSLEDKHNRLAGQQSQIMGHANHKQKIRYTVQLKEENRQLNTELKKTRQRLRQIQACSRSESLLEALTSIVGLQPRGGGALAAAGAATTVPAPVAEPCYHRAGSRPATPRRASAQGSSAAREVSVERGATHRVQDAEKRCRQYERALESVSIDFAHFISLIERGLSARGPGYRPGAVSVRGPGRQESEKSGQEDVAHLLRQLRDMAKGGQQS